MIFSHAVTFFIVPFICLVTAQIPPEKALMMLNECAAENKAGPSVVQSIMEGDIMELDHAGKCVLKCTMVKDGIMNEDGSYNMSNLEEKLRKFEETTKSCMALKGADPCETAFLMSDCNMKAIMGL